MSSSLGFVACLEVSSTTPRAHLTNGRHHAPAGRASRYGRAPCNSEDGELSDTYNNGVILSERKNGKCMGEVVSTFLIAVQCCCRIEHHKNGLSLSDERCEPRVDSSDRPYPAETLKTGIHPMY